MMYEQNTEALQHDVILDGAQCIIINPCFGQRDNVEFEMRCLWKMERVFKTTKLNYDKLTKRSERDLG